MESVAWAAFLGGLGGLVVPALGIVNAERIHVYEEATGVARPIRPPFVLAFLTASLFLGTLGDLIGADQRAHPDAPLDAAIATVVIVLPTVVAPAALALYGYLVLRFGKDVEDAARRLGAVEVGHAAEAPTGARSPPTGASAPGTASP